MTTGRRGLVVALVLGLGLTLALPAAVGVVL